MKIIHSFEELHEIQHNIVIALGTFDGIHIGHRAVINHAKQIATSHDAVLVVVTFEAHPLSILSPSHAPKSLALKETMYAVLDELGVQYVVSLPMTIDLLRMSAHDFMEALSIQNNLLAVVVGENYTYGAKGLGNVTTLQSYFTGTMTTVYVEPLSKWHNSDTPISSTVIRDAISCGQIEYANELLGRAYSFTGTVIKGDQRGRTLGFPTLNFLFPSCMVTPMDGVYANRVCIKGRWYNGVGNIGDNPTFLNQYHRCEVHVFDFDQSVYGETVIVEFIAFLRGEEKFDSLSALIEQMKLDEEKALRILADKNFI